ncbi:MAG: hypothetical protein K2X27_20805, partial [Candidatus Obscuribacterales bacterium]|nr:hypothetical protein [Candidatus Obscuribacterales bacterium]
VLISEQVNTWSIINKYNAGLLCQAEQESTQKALQQWISMEPVCKDAMRVAARRCFEEELNLESKLQAFIDTLKALL